MIKGKFRGVIMIQGVIIAVLILSGCSTMIDKDTELSLKGPKAQVSRKF